MTIFNRHTTPNAIGVTCRYFYIHKNILRMISYDNSISDAINKTASRTDLIFQPALDHHQQSLTDPCVVFIQHVYGTGKPCQAEIDRGNRKTYSYFIISLQWRHDEIKSPTYRLFTQPFVQAQIKGNIKAPRHKPLWGEFTADRLIPHTKHQ